MVNFFVEGQPIPKGRPRLGKGGHVYTPARTVAWETLVRFRGNQEIDAPLAGDLFLELRFYRAGKRRADTDNMCKAVMDALNGCAWVDDTQVTGLLAVVQYESDEPGVNIGISAFKPIAGIKLADAIAKRLKTAI